MQFARTIAAAAMSLMVACPAPAGDAVPFVYLNETATRLSSDPTLGVSDPAKKSYAWGDVNNDGWTDLVVVRKAAFTAQGPLTNVLFLNENGVLTDRTALYASTAINLPSRFTDSGFLTPTNDTDVTLTDVNGDGWMDLVLGRCSGTQVWIFNAPKITGDLSGDGVVDSLDLDILLSSWSIPAGSAGCGGTLPCSADINGDGHVDTLDLGILLSRWTM